MHGNILHMFGYWVPHAYWSRFGGQDSLFGWTVGLAVGWVVNLCAVLWAADVFAREVDARLAALVQRLQGWAFVKDR